MPRIIKENSSEKEGIQGLPGELRWMPAVTGQGLQLDKRDKKDAILASLRDFGI